MIEAHTLLAGLTTDGIAKFCSGDRVLERALWIRDTGGLLAELVAVATHGGGLCLAVDLFRLKS